MAGGLNQLTKVSSDFFYEVGMLHKWTADEMMGAIKSGIDAPSQLLTDAWDDNTNTFRHFGENVGSIAQSGVMIGANAKFLHHSFARFGNDKGYQFKSAAGKITEWEHGPEGKLIRRGFPKSIASEEALLAASKKGLGTLKGGTFARNKSQALWRGKGAFLPEMGFMKGLAVTIGPMVAMSVARSALGLMGSFVDQSLQDYRRSLRHQYDQRYFNTEEANMSSYQTIGSAMRAQEGRYMNVSRAFHSR